MLTKDLSKYDVAIVKLEVTFIWGYGSLIKCSEVKVDDFIKSTHRLVISNEEHFQFDKDGALRDNNGSSLQLATKALGNEATKEVLIADDFYRKKDDQFFYFIVPQGVHSSSAILCMIEEIIYRDELPKWPWGGLPVNKRLSDEIIDVCKNLFQSACKHSYVNIGFNLIKMACKHCGKDQ